MTRSHPDAVAEFAALPSLEVLPAPIPPSGLGRRLTSVFSEAKPSIDSAANYVRSDAALAALRPRLEELGFDVERGKKAVDKIRRPVLFGELGAEALAYEVDAFRATDGIALEVEAGRGARSNAVYRDLIQTALLVDARFLVLAVQQAYRHKTAGQDVTVQSYRDTRNLLDAIYASDRLQLPLEGVLVIGY